MHFAFATKRAVSLHVHRLIFLIMYKYQFVRKCDEDLVSLIIFERYVLFRTEVCTCMKRRTRYQVFAYPVRIIQQQQQCLYFKQYYRLSLLLAAACCCSKFAPDRDSRVPVAFYRCLLPYMVTVYFASVFFRFQVHFFQINQDQP